MANATWSTTDKTAGITLSNGNLTATASATGHGVRATDRQITGKFYWEVTLTSATTSHGVGVALGDAPLVGMWTTPIGAVIVYGSGTIWVNNVSTGINVGSFGAGGLTACLALDKTNSLFWARNGSAGNWNGSATANPATGVGGISISSLSSLATLFPVACFGIAAAVTANFGDSAFVGTVPSGFTSGFTAGATITNNLNVGGLAREALVSDIGQAYLGGLVREALIGGVGLFGSATARSSARATFAVVYAAGQITMRSSAQAAVTVGVAPVSAQGQYAVSIVSS